MRFSGRLSGLCLSSIVAAAVLAAPPVPALAQYQAPSEQLQLSAQTATTWTQDGTDIALLEGPVTIRLDQATLTAQQAVTWITADPDHPQTKRVQVALVGDAKVVQRNATRSGARMMVTAEVSGRIQLRAEERYDRNGSDSALYRAALAMRPPAEPSTAAGTRPTQPAPDHGQPVALPGERPEPAAPAETERPPIAVNPGASVFGPRNVATTRPTTGPTTNTVTPIGPKAPIIFQAPELETVDTDEGRVAVVLSKGVKLVQHRPNGDLIELQAQRAVLFTTLTSLKDLQKGEQTRRIADAIDGAYLEGDVRIVFTPQKPVPLGEQRLTAHRVYYEFATDRAVLTDAVIRTVQARPNIPVTIRAKSVRQLAQGEYNAEKVQLSTSSFAVPSYAIAAAKVYVREDPAPDENLPNRMTFDAKDATFRVFNTPVFYLPEVAGSMTSDQTAVRGIGFGQSSIFGTYGGAELGFFETLGQIPPRDLDVTYRGDYYSDRGPGFGLNARYKGGSINETTKEPTSFEGDFQSYFVYDHGVDEIARPIPDSGQDDYRLRGTALFEHQHYFPDGWQVQLRAGWVSDPTFLEQWFTRDFDRELPRDVSGYVKHQQDNEAFTLLIQGQPSHLITTADLLQEQFEVEHLPEIGYHRIGESFLDDHATLISDDTFAGLHFQKTRASLREQGFIPPTVSPGIPSFGTTGLTNDVVFRGDFRQELDFPLQAGNFKVVPYVVGRYTGYSDSPDDGAKNRLLGAAGARITTEFWKTDDTVESDLFDLHRLRHVIEPEINLFTSGQTVDRNDLFIYDNQVDSINDVTAAQIALHQRWQTYRGGPGRWRSVDFFTLNVEADLFANQPSKAQLDPYGFRGLFYPSMPEASIPRNSINADATWRIADSTVIIADVSQNLDKNRLATASIGLVAQRGEHLTYFIGNRYIADLDSNITSFAFDYELTQKYSFSFYQGFDFSANKNVETSVGIIRRFDSFFLIARAYHNEISGENSFGINIVPNGIGYGLDTGAFQNILNQRR